MTTLSGQSILIVGGSSGIGFGVAKLALLSDAARVVIASSSSSRLASAIDRLVQSLPAASQAEAKSRLSGEVVDARKGEEVRKLMEKVGEIDHLVWTSGESLRLDFMNYNLDEHKDIFDVRFWGAIEAAKVAKIKSGGSIIFTVGAVLKKPGKGWTLMAGMMGAVEAATRGLAVDLAPTRVNTVSPGAVKTELWDSLTTSEAQKETMYDTIGKQLPVKHVGDPDELAEAYIFLMKCKYITGQRIDVDGGSSLA